MAKSPTAQNGGNNNNGGPEDIALPPPQRPGGYLGPANRTPTPREIPIGQRFHPMNQVLGGPGNIVRNRIGGVK
jgi:hypothetical protein